MLYLIDAGIAVKWFIPEVDSAIAHQFLERDIHLQVDPDNTGQFVALDIETGAWEMNADDYTASKIYATCGRTSSSSLLPSASRAFSTS